MSINANELTIDQVNDMMDFLVWRCWTSERAKNYHYMNIMIAMENYFGFNNVTPEDFKHFFPEAYVNVFSNQSERVMYILMVKEFFNR